MRESFLKFAFNMNIFKFEFYEAFFVHFYINLNILSMVELLHLIKGEESTLAFHPQTYSILDLPQQVYKVLSLYQKGFLLDKLP